MFDRTAPVRLDEITDGNHELCFGRCAWYPGWNGSLAQRGCASEVAVEYRQANRWLVADGLQFDQPPVTAS